jgi:IS1 family transposase
MANILPTEKKITATHMLCEGSSIRSIERVTGIHRDTIMRLGVRMGEGCAKIMDEKMQNLSCEKIQVDEIWGFIGAKAKTVKQKKLSAEYGDVWSWIAIDADTKLVPCFAVGDRSKYMAQCFMDDLAARVKTRVQITSDALSAYKDAIERSFGSEVDYGILIKTFTHTDLNTPSTRYSPPDVLKTKKIKVQGSPDFESISTSFVEKQNHTLRMHCRRLTRLTNAFSKKRENFEAAIALHYAYYNFVKTHGTLRCTPGMAAGVTDSHWKVSDLVEMVEAE